MLLRKAAVNNTMIDLQIPDMPWNGKALLREVQSHPWKNSVYHLSFFAVKAQDAVEVGVTLNFIGEPTGVKNDGGILNTEVNEVTVKCKAVDIPESIDVDVSGLGLGDSLTVADLVLPAGAVVAGDQTQTIATVLQGRNADGESTVTTAAVG
jgi:large subunit ribosomal protein L25